METVGTQFISRGRGDETDRGKRGQTAIQNLDIKDLYRDQGPCTQLQGMETVGTPFFYKGREDEVAKGKKVGRQQHRLDRFETQALVHDNIRWRQMVHISSPE